MAESAVTTTPAISVPEADGEAEGEAPLSAVPPPLPQAPRSKSPMVSASNKAHQRPHVAIKPRSTPLSMNDICSPFVSGPHTEANPLWNGLRSARCTAPLWMPTPLCSKTLFIITGVIAGNDCHREYEVVSAMVPTMPASPPSAEPVPKDDLRI